MPFCLIINANVLFYWLITLIATGMFKGLYIPACTDPAAPFPKTVSDTTKFYFVVGSKELDMLPWIVVNP